MRGKKAVTIAATIGVATIACAQAPFDLDPTFVTNINQQGVSSIALLDDGDLLVSGTMRFGSNQTSWRLARLNPDGSRDPNWPSITPPGGGKIVPWSGRAYVAVGQGVKRVWLDGDTDFGFGEMSLDPYIQILLQGGDYHVFPDGRLLITGTHGLSDTVRGYVGLYNLIWITAYGRLDTTRVHRKANGDITTLQRLPDGRFIAAGGFNQYDGHSVGGIIRVEADGSLDTTFQSTLEWFWPFTILPLADGKLLCGGAMRFQGIADTLCLVRLLPNGDLDPTFNNALDYKATWNTGDLGSVSSITPVGLDRFITTGFFDRIDGEARGGIALVDTAGNLLDDLFSDGGCGTFWTGWATTGGIVGMAEAPDGSYYIYGAYHGYDDGTTNGASQRMVSRLYGLDVGVEEEGGVEVVDALRVYPNPAEGQCTVQWARSVNAGTLEMVDVLGRVVFTAPVQGTSKRMDLGLLPAGTYYLHLRDGKRWLAGGKVVVQH